MSKELTTEEYYNKLWLENKELIQENIDRLNKKRFAQVLMLADKDKEIERLNKCYCERTDCSGRIKNSKKYESMQEEIERLKNDIKRITEITNQKIKIINEVREYIENNTLYEQDYDYDYEENLTEYPPSDEQARKDILNILDKEKE